MTQRSKILLIFSVTILLFAGSAMVISLFIYQRSVKALEETTLHGAGQRLLNLIEDDLDQLDRITTDWAYWDDTWEYMTGNSPEYETSNLTADAFQNLGLAGIYFFTVDGTIRYRYTSDGRPGTDLEQLGQIQASDIFAEGKKGILRAGGTLFLVAGRAILHSDGYGPAVGTLWFVWPLGDRRIARYSRLLGFTITMLAEGKNYQKFERSGNLITMTMDLNDMYGDRACTMALTEERIIYKLGSTAMGNFFFAMFFALAVISFVLYIIIKKQFLNPLKKLTQQLENRRDHPDEPLVLQGIQHDEIDELIRAFNDLTEALVTKIHEREKLLHEIYHRVYNNLQIMASILQLQTYHSKNAETIGAIQQGRRRILAIAQVQRILYEQDDITNIPLESCLHTIVSDFEPEETLPIVIRLTSDFSKLEGLNLSLTLEQAVPLSLVLSELLSNCYAHAFSGKSEGTIIVQGYYDREINMLHIAVIDDGIGINSSGQKVTGLGLELANNLIAQIGGTFTIRGRAEGGTRAEIRLAL